jgi:transposase
MARYGRLLTDAQWEKIRPLLPQRPACGSRPQSAGRHFVDFAQRGALAGPAGGVSASLDLLATAAALVYRLLC